jgi:hypothetical protein
MSVQRGEAKQATCAAQILRHLITVTPAERSLVQDLGFDLQQIVQGEISRLHQKAAETSYAN